MTIFLMALAFAGGFAACWFAKDKLLALVHGADTLARSLEAKAAQLRAKL